MRAGQGPDTMATLRLAQRCHSVHSPSLPFTPAMLLCGPEVLTSGRRHGPSTTGTGVALPLTPGLQWMLMATAPASAGGGGGQPRTARMRASLLWVVTASTEGRVYIPASMLLPGFSTCRTLHGAVRQHRARLPPPLPLTTAASGRGAHACRQVRAARSKQQHLALCALQSRIEWQRVSQPACGGPDTRHVAGGPTRA